MATSVGCEKDSEKLTWEDTDRPPTIEENKKKAAQLKAPAMFASIPADTPYVFAAFEPIPHTYWKHVCDEMCPALEKLLGHAAELAGRAGGVEARIGKAVLSELRGNMSADGLRKLGFSAEPVFAIYGLGPMPVGRIEIGDPKALAATIARVEGKAGVKLPTRTLGQQEYWLAEAEGVWIAIGIVGKELVVTGGPRRAVERAIPILFGGEKLANTMADGAALKKLAADYGFASYGLGYVDLARFADLATSDPSTDIHAQMFDFHWGGGGRRARAEEPAPVAPDRAESGSEGDAERMKLKEQVSSTGVLELLSKKDPATEANLIGLDSSNDIGSGLGDLGIAADPAQSRRVRPTGDPLRSPACRAELQNLAQSIPRAVAGYDEVSAKRAVLSAALETSPTIAKRLKAVQASVPGLTTRLYGRPLFALGGAVNIARGRELMTSMAGEMDRIGRQCGFESWVGFGDGFDEALELPTMFLPDFVSDMRGALVVLQSMEISGAMPKNIRGYAVIGLDDPGAALAELEQSGGGDLQADGRFHSIPMGPAAGILSSLKVAAKGDALVVAAGKNSGTLVDKVMAQKGGRSPLLIVAYDVGGVTKLMRKATEAAGDLGGAESAMLTDLFLAQEKLFGLFVMWITPTDRGLELVCRADIN